MNLTKPDENRMKLIISILLAVTCCAAGLPCGVVGELRRKLGPIALAVLLLFMGVGVMDSRVSAEFPSSRQRGQRAAFS